MSLQRLSDKKLRAIGRLIDVPNLKHGVGNGGFLFNLVTRDHHHFLYDMKIQVAYPSDGPNAIHISSCPGHFTDDGDWDV